VSNFGSLKILAARVLAVSTLDLRASLK